MARRLPTTTPIALPKSLSSPRKVLTSLLIWINSKRPTSSKLSAGLRETRPALPNSWRCLSAHCDTYSTNTVFEVLRPRCGTSAAQGSRRLDAVRLTRRFADARTTSLNWPPAPAKAENPCSPPQSNSVEPTLTEYVSDLLPQFVTKPKALSHRLSPKTPLLLPFLKLQWHRPCKTTNRALHPVTSLRQTVGASKHCSRSTNNEMNTNKRQEGFSLMNSSSSLRLPVLSPSQS